MLSRMNYRTMSGQLNLSKGNRKVKTTAWLDVGLNKKGKKKVCLFLQLLLNPDYESLRILICVTGTLCSYCFHYDNIMILFLQNNSGKKLQDKIQDSSAVFELTTTFLQLALEGSVFCWHKMKAKQYLKSCAEVTCNFLYSTEILFSQLHRI